MEDETIMKLVRAKAAMEALAVGEMVVFDSPLTNEDISLIHGMYTPASTMAWRMQRRKTPWWSFADAPTVSATRYR
jgi:hypothetical protein